MRFLSVVAILTLYIQGWASSPLDGTSESDIISGAHSPHARSTPGLERGRAAHRASVPRRSQHIEPLSRLTQQALAGADLSLLQRAGAEEIAQVTSQTDASSWVSSAGFATSHFFAAESPLSSYGGAGFVMIWAAATVIFIACACYGFGGLFDVGESEDHPRKPLRHSRKNEGYDESDSYGEVKPSARRSWWDTTTAMVYTDGYGGRQMVPEKRIWPPSPLYTGPAPEGDCVFMLPLNTLFRRGKGQTPLPEVSGKLEFRAATLGSEGWPLVVFIGTGRMPAATIGPALQDTPVAGPGSLELRSGDGSHYGVLDRKGEDKCVVSCGGSPLLSVEGIGGLSARKMRHLSVFCGDGSPVAEVCIKEEVVAQTSDSAALSPVKNPELELRIFKGRDPVLVMISVLAMLLYGQKHGKGSAPSKGGSSSSLA